MQLVFPPVGVKAARDTARRAWLMLAAVGMVPALPAARMMPDFLTPGSPAPLSDGAPNVWAIVQAVPWIGGLPLAGLAMAAAIGAAAWLAAHFSYRPPRGEAVLSSALLIALVVPGLLPQMRPQDFLLAVMLNVVLSVRRRAPITGALVAGGYLLAIGGLAIIGALFMIAATALIARPFLASPANDNGLPINRVVPFPA